MKFILTVVVLLAFLSCKRYEPFEERIENDFTLSITDSTGAINDGKFIVKISLQNTKDVKDGLKVTFETNKGAYQANNIKFENHKAETFLKLDSDTGLYVIKAVLKDGEAVKLEKLVYVSFRPQYNVNDFILSVTDTSGVRSDATAVIKVNLSNSNIVKDGLKVTFQTNKGVFLLNDVKFENHKAETLLKVDQDTGIYVLKALLKDGEQVKVEKLILFNFRRANPDVIALQVSRTLYSLTTPTTITTYLLRNTGLVTKGTSANFRAFQISATNDTILVGRFEGLLNNFSDVSGKLSDIKLYTDGPLIDTNRAIIIQAKAINDHIDTIRTNYSITYH